MADGNNSGSGWGWFWLVVVIALVGGGYLYQREGGKVFGPGGVVNPGPQVDPRKQVPLAASYGWDREDNLLVDDKYRITITIYHTAPNPISGRVIIRAYGDVFGEGGEESPGADNYDFGDLANAPPGESGGYTALYYVNNPALRANNLPAETVKTNATMRFHVDFQPASSEKDWRPTTWKFEIRKGQFVDLEMEGFVKEMEAKKKSQQ